MSDRPRSKPIDIHGLRSRVSWMFYGIRDFGALDETSKDVVDDIINDGYERFLNPLPIAGEKRSHKWGFLRPYREIVTEDGTQDYALPSDFGGLDSRLYYDSSSNRPVPVRKTDAARIEMLRQRNTSSFTGYPKEFAVVSNYPVGKDGTGSLLMLWPTPDAAYTLRFRYFVLSLELSDENPVPACDAFHNQTLIESCLAVAEERLEDQQSMHSKNFMERLIASVHHDQELYASDHVSIDRDTSDERYVFTDIHFAGDYTGYNGYVPGG